jgi:hypothetical protein
MLLHFENTCGWTFVHVWHHKSPLNCNNAWALVSTSNSNEYVVGVNGSRGVRLTATSVSRLCRKCGRYNISHTYGPLWTVNGSLSSSFRISLGALISVCVYCVFVLSCPDPPSKESYRLFVRLGNGQKRPGPNDRLYNLSWWWWWWWWWWFNSLSFICLVNRYKDNYRHITV